MRRYVGENVARQMDGDLVPYDDAVLFAEEKIKILEAENKRLREALVPIVEAWEHYKDDLFLSNKAEAKPKPICSCWPYLSNLWCAIRLSIRTKNSNEINMGDLLGQLRVWPDKLTR